MIPLRPLGVVFLEQVFDFVVKMLVSLSKDFIYLVEKQS